MVKLAHTAAHHDTVLFVCGHTHMAQSVMINERQTYVNVGTWTDVVTDLTTGRRQQQRCPFLLVQYDAMGEMSYEFLVWRGRDTAPTMWAPETVAEVRHERRTQNPVHFAEDGVTITSWKKDEGDSR
jgi:hypothetical protein